jgi:hypothetical protein
MYVSGAKAVEDGCTLVDENGKEIPSENVSNVIAIVDGAHRHSASVNLVMNPANIYLFECYAEANTRDILAATNIESQPWAGSDYPKGAKLLNSGSELARFASLMASNKYSLSTISKILCHNTKLTKAIYGDIMAQKVIKLDYNIEDATLFMECASDKFEHSFIAKRYLIDATLGATEKNGFEKACKAIKELTQEEVDNTLKLKGDKTAYLKECLLSKIN